MEKTSKINKRTPMFIPYSRVVNNGQNLVNVVKERPLSSYLYRPLFPQCQNGLCFLVFFEDTDQ